MPESTIQCRETRGAPSGTGGSALDPEVVSQMLGRAATTIRSSIDGEIAAELWSASARSFLDQPG